MFDKIIKYLSPSKEVSEYIPVKHSFFRDPEIGRQLHENGFYIADFLGEKERLELLKVHNEHHQIKDTKGGAFLSLFSKNLEYRKAINTAVNRIMSPTFEKWFTGYKNVVNLFIIKTSGSSGKVAIHQDSAVIDEFKHSSINVWIPLQEINDQNGPLCIIPRSHHMFVPYRGATIEPLSKNIENILYPYFVPIHLKPGQALFFDSRMFHFSPPNVSGQARLVVVCRICPIEAAPIVYFKDGSDNESKLEMWSCPDDYMMKYDGYADNMRPEGGKLIGYKPVPMPMTINEFERRRIKYGITVQNYFSDADTAQSHFIQEPIIQEDSK